MSWTIMVYAVNLGFSHTVVSYHLLSHVTAWYRQVKVLLLSLAGSYIIPSHISDIIL